MKKSLVLAIIPARGGSKGIYRKNLVNIAGKPMLAYTIEAALKSDMIDQVWVSSDDEDILSVASKYGAKIIFRPSEFADDTASSVDVVQHFFSCLSESIKLNNPLIIYLQPTSPLRNANHINSALTAMNSINADGVISVVAADKPPQKSFKLDSNGRLISLFDESLSNARRQDLPNCYYPNGAIYAFRMNDFISRKGFPSNGSIPFIMSKSDSIDVDTISDLIIVEAALGEQNG